MTGAVRTVLGPGPGDCPGPCPLAKPLGIAPDLVHERFQMSLDAIYCMSYLGQGRSMPSRDSVQCVQGPDRLGGIAQRIDGVDELFFVIGPHARRVDVHDRSDCLLNGLPGSCRTALDVGKGVWTALTIAARRCL